MRDAAIIVDFDSQPNNVNHPPCLLSTLGSSFLATDNISATKVLLRQSFFYEKLYAAYDAREIAMTFHFFCDFTSFDSRI